MDPPSIFVKDDGTPCKLFVEATSVRERPKLVRKIFKNGGHVVNAARDADVILAENQTKEALELLDAWKEDKIVLSTRWVTTCLQENIFLGADRGWGGFELTREGLLEGIRMHAGDVDDEDDNYEAPSKRTAATLAGREATPRKSDSKLSRSHGSPTKGTPSRHSSKRDLEMESKPSSSSRIPRSETPSEDPLRLGPRPVTSTDGGPPIPSSSQTQANITQQALMSSMFGSLFQQSPLQQQIPHLYPVTPPGPLHNFLQLQPLPNLQQYNTNQVQLLAQQLLMNPHLLNPQLKESLEQLNLASERLSQAGQAPAANSNEQQNHPARPTPDDADVISDSTESAGHSIEYAITPKTNKGKERAVSSHHDRKIEKGIRSKPLISKEIVVSDDRGIFTDDWGMPKKFYIMVDLKNRKDLLKIVKKHRGTMVSEMDQADHVILNNRSNQFQPILSTLPVHKVALSPGWLEACDEKDALVDLAPFVIDFTSGIGLGAQRKKPTRRVVPVDKVECESEEENQEWPKPLVTATPMTPKTPTKMQARRLKRDADSPRSGSRSPSPPIRIVRGPKGNLYTEEDRQWFFKYARFKLERKPDTSQTALLKLIGRKAPHHSASSWSNVWRRNWPGEMAALKQDIAALAKSAAATLPTPSVASASSAATYSSPFPHSQPSMSTPSGSRNALQSDNHDLAYPDDDSSPTRSQLDSHPPPSSAPVSSSSTQVTPRRSIGTESLKRKEQWEDVSGTTVVVDRDGKRIKVAQDIIDVDSFPDR